MERYHITKNNFTNFKSWGGLQMKNNVKYAGIAAAALLAVAPVATPVANTLSNTNTVQAAGIKTATQDQKNTLNQYFNTLSDVSTDQGANFNYFSDIDANNYAKDMPYEQFCDLASIIAAGNNTGIKDDAALKDNDIKYQIVGLNGSSVLNFADFQTKVKDIQKNGGSVNLKLTATDTDGTVLQDKTISFTNNNKQTEGVTSLNVSFDDPYEAEVGSSTTNPKYTTSVNADVTDQNGNDVKVTKVTPSQNIYKTSTAALDQDANQLFTDSTFSTKGDTYYQAVALTIDSDVVNVKDIYNNMQNGKDAQFMINDKPAIAANVDGKAGQNTIRFVREIQVGDKATTPSDDTWTETDQAGVVSVTSEIGHLYNDDNELTSRSLGPNTDWQTDKYRTNNETGQVQYHVSTHEWVNATDVSFKDNNNSGSTNGLGNVTDLTGHHVVNLDGPAGFVYTLFTSDGKTASRGLAGLTSWLTDKTATDADGNTYYRVSTDEWVRQGNGVNFN